MRLALALFLAFAAPANAQTPLTPAQRQAILDYQLTMPKVVSLTTAIVALNKYIAALPNAQERRLKLSTMTPAELQALTEKDANAMAILTRNGLTAREYLVGTSALVMAYTLAATGAEPNPYVFASPANLAFAKTNLSQLKPKMDAVRAAARGQ